MTTAELQNKTRVTSKTTPEAAVAKVRLLFASWESTEHTPSVTHRFDPKQAGRRAASKHTDALRRLST